MFTCLPIYIVLTFSPAVMKQKIYTNVFGWITGIKVIGHRGCGLFGFFGGGGSARKLDFF